MLSVSPQQALEIIAFRVSWAVLSVPESYTGLDHESTPPVLHDRQYWNALGEVLSSPSRYPKLRGVRFTPDMTYGVAPGREQTEVEDAFELSLPTMFRSEMMAAMEATSKRLLVYVPCHGGDQDVGEMEAARLFWEMSANIRDQVERIP
jgi:hypothetical protein